MVDNLEVYMPDSDPEDVSDHHDRVQAPSPFIIAAIGWSLYSYFLYKCSRWMVGLGLFYCALVIY